MEQIDIFDEEFNALDPGTTSIDVVHRQGLWHQTFACWLINPDENKIYLQLRGPKNRIGPNTLDASASGHLSAGEQSEDGFRELEEELGKNLKIYDKTYLGVYRNIIRKGAYINREFCHVYMAKTLNGLDDFDLQEGEVSGIFSMDINNGVKLFSGALKTADINGRVFNGRVFLSDTRKISTNDFCAPYERVTLSDYYLKVMMNAARYRQNNPPYGI